MIVASTVMKVIYDREKLKQAAQRALSKSWQSAKNFSVSSRNIMLNVSRHSSVLNLSRHGPGVGGSGSGGGRGSNGTASGSQKNPMGFTSKDWNFLNAVVDKE